MLISGDLRRHNMHVHESRDKSFDFDDSSAMQLNTNNNNDTQKTQAIRGQLHRCSECQEVCNSSAELGHHMLLHDSSMKSGYGGLTLNHKIITSEKPSQEADRLDESTESGSGDSN